jgi:hypothetical protein
VHTTVVRLPAGKAVAGDAARDRFRARQAGADPSQGAAQLVESTIRKVNVRKNGVRTRSNY